VRVNVLHFAQKDHSLCTSSAGTEGYHHSFNHHHPLLGHVKYRSKLEQNNHTTNLLEDEKKKQVKGRAELKIENEENNHIPMP